MKRLAMVLAIATMVPATAADFSTGYTIGSGLLGPTIVDGADSAGLGTFDLRANDSANGAGAYAWLAVWEGLWSVGDTVSLTGLALPLRSPGDSGDSSNNTDSGTFTFTFYELAGGADANAWDGTANGETVLTTATADFNADGTDPAIVAYVTFDSPVAFTATSGGIAIHVDSTSSIRTRKDDSADGVDGIQENRTNGNDTLNGHQWTIAGTVSGAPDGDMDGLPDSVETGGLFGNGDPLGTFVSESDTGTWADVADSDGDGINDGDEVNGESVSGQNYTSDPTTASSDSDTLDDGVEVNGTANTAYGNAPTDPAVADTDGDGIDDDVEINTTGTNPAVADTDGDGLDDGAEDVNQNGVVDAGETSATSGDTDSDNLPDDWELANGLDPQDDGTTDPDNGENGDPDGDLLVNSGEYNGGTSSTDPNDPDSDNDGLDDKFERDSTGLGMLLAPNDRDTDDDGLGDKYEIDNGLDPFSDADFDNDFYTDADEVLFFGTNAKDIDDFPGDIDSLGPGELTEILDGGTVAPAETFDLSGTLGSAIINEVAQGGSDLTFPTGVSDFTAVYDNAFAAAGTSVSITGFAWVVTGAGNDDGEILVEFYDPGVDGVFDGVDSETLVGKATGSLFNTGSTTVMYWNFDTPITFTSAGTGLAVRILGTEALRIKVQNDVASGFRFLNKGGAIANNNSVRFSIGGTAISPSLISLDLADYNGGSPILNWTPSGAANGIDLYRSIDLQNWTGPISTDDQDGTHTDTTAPAGAAYYLAVPTGDPAP